jgi:hypothetical protein
MSKKTYFMVFIFRDLMPFIMRYWLYWVREWPAGRDTALEKKITLPEGFALPEDVCNFFLLKVTGLIHAF